MITYESTLVYIIYCYAYSIQPPCLVRKLFLKGGVLILTVDYNCAIEETISTKGLEIGTFPRPLACQMELDKRTFGLPAVPNEGLYLYPLPSCSL